MTDRNVPTVSVVSQSRMCIVAPAREWLAATKRAYAEFWGDDVAKLVKPAAVQLVHRYFDLLDQRERAMRRLRAEPETTGSTGQRVLNPSGTFVLNLESALSRMESALGVDPASRARLKLDEVTASDTLDRLFRRARGEETDQ